MRFNNLGIQSMAASFLLLLLFPITTRAHEAGHPGPTSPTPWTDAPVLDDPDDFHFAIVSDRTGGARIGVFQSALTKVNLLHPQFVMSVGDLIEGETEDLEQVSREWDEFESFLRRLDMRFYFLPGNHDISNKTMAAEWERRFGASYFHFVHRNVLFLCLNTEDEKPSAITEKQVAYATEVLDDHPDVRWTLVFLHKPLWLYDDPSGWSAIEGGLVDRPHTVFAGHKHFYRKAIRNDQGYFILATTGGGSPLRGPAFGTFDHVVWVTMTDRGPRLANLMLDGIWDENVRLAKDQPFTDALSGNFSAVLHPILLDEDHFGGGTSTLTIANPTDRPLVFAGRFTASEQLRLLPSSVDTSIAAGDTVQIQVDVRPFDSLTVGAVSPVRLSWDVAADSLTRIGGSSSLAVLPLLDLVAADGAVKVDGKLDDWPELPIVCTIPAEIQANPEYWQGAEDCSFRFGITYDDRAFYFGIEVTDDHFVADAESWTWSQDGIGVRFDARPDPVRSTSQGRGVYSEIVYVGVSPTDDPQVVALNRPDKLEEWGIEAHARRTGNGFAAEFSLPISYIEQRQGDGWRDLRLGVYVTDLDPDQKVAALAWQPYWHLEADIPGSGTFRRR